MFIDRLLEIGFSQEHIGAPITEFRTVDNRHDLAFGDAIADFDVNSPNQSIKWRFHLHVTGGIVFNSTGNDPL